MKKMMKCVAVLSAMLVFMSALTGCRQFEEIRQSHVTLTKEGNILVQGKEYRPLPYCEYLNPEWESYDRSLYLTAEDIPVLLSRQFGVRMDISKDKKFINSHYLGETVETVGLDGKYSYDGATNTFFCRSDEYDSIMAVIEKGYEPDGYKCDYYDWEADGMVEYVFSHQEAEAVEQVLKTKPVENSDELNFTQSCAISSCMIGTPFSQYEAELWFGEDQAYYIDIYDLKNEMSLYYQVPAELEAVFEGILAKCNF